jgi:hypothetical protein
MSGSKPGERRGGRKAGVPNKATAEIRALARGHGPDAIRELARLAKEARSEQARISRLQCAPRPRIWSLTDEPAFRLDLPDVSELGGITEALTAILRSTANGELTPSEAQALGGLKRSARQSKP